jgi:hypothetical protein
LTKGVSKGYQIVIRELLSTSINGDGRLRDPGSDSIVDLFGIGGIHNGNDVAPNTFIGCRFLDQSIVGLYKFLTGWYRTLAGRSSFIAKQTSLAHTRDKFVLCNPRHCGSIRAIVIASNIAPTKVLHGVLGNHKINH